MTAPGAVRPPDDVAGRSDDELRKTLLTLDGRGVQNKAAALDELLDRAISAAAAHVRASGYLARVVDINTSDVDMTKRPGISLPDAYQVGQRVRVIVEPEAPEGRGEAGDQTLENQL